MRNNNQRHIVYVIIEVHIISTHSNVICRHIRQYVLNVMICNDIGANNIMTYVEVNVKFMIYCGN